MKPLTLPLVWGVAAVLAVGTGAAVIAGPDTPALSADQVHSKLAAARASAPDPTPVSSPGLMLTPGPLPTPDPAATAGPPVGPDAPPWAQPNVIPAVSAGGEVFVRCVDKEATTTLVGSAPLPGYRVVVLKAGPAPEVSVRFVSEIYAPVTLTVGCGADPDVRPGDSFARWTIEKQEVGAGKVHPEGRNALPLTVPPTGT